jgi:CHAT domain-containing protein/tetratricopeptide (TPR) repeat protein
MPTMPMPDQNLMAKTLQAFGQHDYQAVAQRVYAMFPHVTILMMQIFLISIQRLGLDDEVAEFIKDRLPRLAPIPWAHALASLMLGLREPRDVFAMVSDEEQAAEFYLCLGSRLLTLGQVEAARQHFQNCLRVPGRHIEKLVAEDQMGWSSQQPELVSGERWRVVRASQEVRRLMSAGEIPKALEIAGAIYEQLAQMPTICVRERLAVIGNYASAQYEAGNDEASLALCNESLQLIERTHVSGLFDTSAPYSVLGFIHARRGNPDEAIALAQRALAERKSALGDKAPMVLTTLENLITLLNRFSMRDAATPYALEAMEILDASATGQVTADVEDQWARIARHLMQHGSPSQKEELSRKFIAFQTRAGLTGAQAEAQLLRFVEKSEPVGKAPADAPLNPSAQRESELREQVETFLRQQRYFEALQPAASLITLHRQDASLEPRSRARSFFLQSVTLLQTGDMQGTIEAAEESLRFWERQPPTPILAQLHDILGRAHRQVGDVAGALPHLRTAVELNENLQQPATQRVDALFALGGALIGLQKHAEARTWLEKAQKLSHEAGLPVSTRQIELLNALSVATLPESLAESEKLARAAVAAAHSLGEQLPPRLASMVQQNLAVSLMTQEKFADALQVLGGIEETVRSTFGEASPDFIHYLMVRGEAAVGAGERAGGEASLQRALQISQSMSPPDDQTISRIIISLARSRAAAGDHVGAVEIMLAIQPYRQRALAQFVALAGDVERRQYYNHFLKYELDFLLSAAAHAQAIPAVLALRLWEFVVRRKTISMEVMMLRHSSEVYREADRPLKQRLRDLRQQAATMEMQGPSRDADEANRYLADLYALRGQIASIEEQLGSSVWVRSHLLATLSVEARLLVARLQPCCSLVEFVRYRHIVDFRTGPIPESEAGDEAYLAFVVADSLGTVATVPLGATEPIDAAIRALRPGDGGRGLQFLGPAGGGDAARPASPIADDPILWLNNTIVVPLLAHIPRETEKLLLAPDSELNRLPFAALMDPRGKHVIDRFRISYIPSGRNLAEERRPPVAASAAVVIGDPDYDWNGSGDATMPTGSAGAGTPKGQGLGSDVLHGYSSFERLTASRAEAESVARILHVRPIMQRDAVKARLAEARSPLVLHIATHGYFLRSEAPEGLGVASGFHLEPVIAIAAEDAIGGRLSLRIQNPLLRSGLVLAGANAWLSHQPTSRDVGDGLLSAENVIGMDLEGTELVVLSACDTGLGDIRTGEGVLGLQRAFAIAGARTLIMSLWKVPDAVTCMLVEKFYASACVPGRTIDAALREAQLSIRMLRASEFLERWKHTEGANLGFGSAFRDMTNLPEDSYPFAHEAFWGGFVCMGDVSPLLARPNWVTHARS